MINILIPMAGLGTRFSNEGFSLPKPLIEVGNKSLIEHSVESLGIDGRYIFITRKYENENDNITLSKKLKEIKPNSVEIILDRETRGAVETCMSALDYIDNDDELIITNCDQKMDWDHNNFLKFLKDSKDDGVIVTYESDNPKNSFAKIDDNGYVINLVEKNPISKVALVGIHYWKKGRDFVKSGNDLILRYNELKSPECYISESYNFLLNEGKKIKIYEISNNEYVSLGTPYDLSIYQSKIKEFYTEKPKTIFCDIDGTILKHVHKFSDVSFTEPSVLDGVIKKFNEWDSQGHKIILCTARKESARQITEYHLNSLGLCWDQLIMGVTSGERVLINDKLNINDNDRSISINVITNGGFNNVDWTKYKL